MNHHLYNEEENTSCNLSTSNNSNSNSVVEEEDDIDHMDLKRGPWTVDEDLKLIDYISAHGEGRWNSLSRSAGLKRTGKSCRLRWLNYLRPDVRRGNITLEEQLIILELHSRWGNRWSKIAQHLPGRTDNEIKNYWRTRVQKHAKQLKCDVNSKQFKDTMRYLWMPRLVERIQAASSSSSSTTNTTTMAPDSLPDPQTMIAAAATPENSCVTGTSSESFAMESSSYHYNYNDNSNSVQASHDNYQSHIDNSSYFDHHQVGNYQEYPYYTPPSGSGNYINQGQGLDYQYHQQDYNNNNPWLNSGDTSDILWNLDDVWFLQHQLNGI